MKKETKNNIKFAAAMIALLLSFPLTKYPTHIATEIVHKEKLELKDDILDDIVKAYLENEISKKNSIAVACGYYAKMFESGIISITNNIEGTEDGLYDYNYELDYDCLVGKAMCRNENLLISNLLSRSGFDTKCLANKIEDGEYHSYILIFDKENNKKYIYDNTRYCFWKFDDMHNTTSIDINGNNNQNSFNLTIASLGGVIDFNYVDIIKMATYDNDVDFKKLYDDFLEGVKAFNYIDQEKITNLIEDKKQKIKKLEQQ